MRRKYGDANHAFSTSVDKFVVVFVDDMLIYSRNEIEHDEYMKIILERLRKNQRHAKFSKCDFCLEKVAFLGHYVSKEGVSVDHAKIQAVVSGHLQSMCQILEVPTSSWLL